MRKLSRSDIRKKAESELVYARGYQLYRSGSIVNAVWSKLYHRYRIIVRAEQEYSVLLAEQESNGELSYTCNCPASVRSRAACVHVVAALFFLMNYQEKELLQAPVQSSEERRAAQILEYFETRESIASELPPFHLEPILRIDGMLKEASGCAALSLRMGTERLYKVASVKKLIMELKEEKTVEIGLHLRFQPNEDCFDAASERLLRYLTEIYEIGMLTGAVQLTTLFHKNEVLLTRQMLLHLLKLMEGHTFAFSLYGKRYEEVTFHQANPQVPLLLQTEAAAVTLQYAGKSQVVALTDDGSLLFYENTLFAPSADFMRAFMPFYNMVASDGKPVRFSEGYKERFLEEVLPHIHTVLGLNIPEELKELYLSLPFHAKLYLDLGADRCIYARLLYCYGDYEFISTGHPSTAPHILIREPQREADCVNCLLDAQFEQFRDGFVMRETKHIYTLLSERLPILVEAFELYYSDSFQRMKIRSGGRVQVKVRAAERVDLLEMDLSYDGIEQEELRAIYRACLQQKTYYRLRDDTFLKLDSDVVRRLTAVLENLDVMPKSMPTDKLTIGRNNLFYLEKIFSEPYFEADIEEALTRSLERLRHPEQSAYPIPRGICATLRGYQEVGYRWLRLLSDNGLCGILADDMGLGKTLQAIAYIAGSIESAKEENTRFLVVCPSSLIYNWLDEFEHFAPELTVAAIAGARQERERCLMETEAAVLITSYALLRRDVALYRAFTLHTVFLDEAQFIKNVGSVNATSVKQLRCAHRFALTGTPIENSLSELWSVFDFLMPGYLMNHNRFVNCYVKQIQRKEEGAIEELVTRTNPFILRRMKQDVLSELPDKIEEKMISELTDEQRAVYLSYMSYARNEFEEEIARNGLEKSQMKLLVLLTRLRQICCHPATFIEDYSGGSGKLEQLLQILPGALAGGHRILIFSQFTKMLRLIAAELERREYPYFYMDGSTKPEDRLGLVKRFNDGENALFLISLKAGGTGLNLIGADMVIHFDPWWNPAVENQATDRAYRIGQTRNVYVLRLLTRGTIEEKIYRLQQQKKELADTVLESADGLFSKLTLTELRTLFQ